MDCILSRWDEKTITLHAMAAAAPKIERCGGAWHCNCGAVLGCGSQQSTLRCDWTTICVAFSCT